MIYKWGEGFRISGDAQKIGEQLERLHQHEGQLTAEIVVRDAEQSSSVTHGQFEWDDTAAAQKYRLVQARKLLAAIVYIPDETPGDEPLRFYVHLDNGKSYYTTIIAAMSDEEKRQQVLRRALHELESWERRYKAYEELAEIFSSAVRVRETVEVK